MSKYELAIAVVDEQDHTLGKYRKKEGDILAVRPHPWKWGRKEIDECLIVIIECSDEWNPLRRRLIRTMYSDGHELDETFREIQAEDEGMVDIGKYPPSKYVLSLPSEIPMLKPQYIGKRKYKIPLNKIGVVDQIKIQNKAYIYQPFKSETQLVEAFDGKNGNYLLRKEDVDCSATGITADQEKSFTWDDNIELIQDKSDNSYIKPKTVSVISGK